MTLSDEVFTYSPELLKDTALAKIFELTASAFMMLLLFFVLYLVSAISMTTIAKKMKFSSPYVAFIPLASPYIEGRIYDRMRGEKLDKSHSRIHYLMFGIGYSLLWLGTYVYNFITSVNQCIEMYNTGAIPLSLLSETKDPAYMAVYILMVAVGIIVAGFRMRMLFMAHICFDKKKGMFLASFLSLVFPVVTPFYYYSISKLTPVNFDLDKIDSDFIKNK